MLQHREFTEVELANDGSDGSAPVTDDRWRDLAACKGRTSLFFARRAERPEARLRRETQANRLCAQCDVAQPCREFARSNHEYGYWAGESEEERHHLGYTVSAPIGVRIRATSRAV